MRKALLLALGLALVAGTAGADGEKIGYHPPALAITGGTLTGALSGTTAFFTGPVSIGNTSAAPYANLYGDAANTLALRNGGTAGTPVPQTFNVYNFCDGAACATGYSRLRIGFASSAFEIATEGAGTGSGAHLRIIPGSGITYHTGNFRPTITDVYSIGESGGAWTNGFISRSIQGSKSKSLTDAAAAVSFVRIAVPTNGYIGGKVIWTATSTDGTDQLTTSAEELFSGVDKGGTVTCGVGAALGTSTAYTTAKTLVCTVTAATSTTNCDLQVTCTNDTAGAQTLVFYYRLDMPLTATVTPQ